MPWMRPFTTNEHGSISSTRVCAKDVVSTVPYDEVRALSTRSGRFGGFSLQRGGRICCYYLLTPLSFL